MKTKLNAYGSTLLFIVLAIFAVGALALGIQKISSVTVMNELMFNQRNKARNLAYSGIEYTKGLISYYQSQSKTFQEFSESLTTNNGTYDFGDKDGSFKVSIVEQKTNGNTTTFKLSVTGQTPDGPNQAKYQIPSNVSLTYIRGVSVPDTNYASAVSFSGKYTGDFTFKGATFNGGVVIDGSLVNLGSTVMKLQGNRIGKSDSSSYICSNSGITIDGNLSVYGTVTAQSDININNGTIYGNATTGGGAYLAQWNGYIKKTSTLGGNLNLYGTINDEGMKNVEGTIGYIYSKPDLCTSVTLPSHNTVQSSKILKKYASMTFVGTGIDDTKTYAYTSISTNGGAKTCFDLSNPNTYINIFVSGDLDFESSIFIRSSASKDCFDSENKITSSNYTSSKFTDAAKRIYMDVSGASTFSGDGHAWVGTLFSKGDITTEGGFTSTGALYSDGSVETGGGTSTYYVKSDYAEKYWKVSSP